MSLITHSTLAAAALLVGLGVAHAQTAQEHDAHHPDAGRRLRRRLPCRHRAEWLWIK